MSIYDDISTFDTGIEPSYQYMNKISPFDTSTITKLPESGYMSCDINMSEVVMDSVL